MGFLQLGRSSRIAPALILASMGSALCAAPGPVSRVQQNEVAELSWRSSGHSADPFREVRFDVEITDPAGTVRTHPGYWAGGDRWSLRFSSDALGAHRYSTRSNDSSLDARSGTIEVTVYDGPNALLRHGALRLSADRRYLVHADGTPFFWLADSWWHGMTRRLRWPEGFKTLVADRVEKGFNVIQFAIGFSCDVPPFDPRDANEAGHAWTPGYGTINPAYFDLVDRRIAHLVERGLVPNIVGAWGYYLESMGVENAKLHWRYLVARYGALPVTWMLCGESTLVWYDLEGEAAERALDFQRAGWSDVGRHLKAVDPARRLLTVHPGPGPGGFRPIDDMDLIDFVLLQPGHTEYAAMPASLEHLAKSRELYPDRPSMMGEVCFEGMNAGCGPKVQRFLFWSTVLGGAPGFSYGVDALWQMNTRAELFGPSPGGHVWGNTPWEEAYQWEGSRNLGAGRRILEQLEWWRLSPAPELTRGSVGGFLAPKAASLDGRAWLVYFPVHVPPWGKPYVLSSLPPGARLRAAWHNPRDGSRHAIGEVQTSAAGAWQVPPAPVLQDWVLLLERMGPSDASD